MYFGFSPVILVPNHCKLTGKNVYLVCVLHPKCDQWQNMKCEIDNDGGPLTKTDLNDLEL